ncbi:VOC family protein [Sphingobacterium faecium]|uniref:VOC family protein n=1 Tax=Sphingobacterium faecium TaxID=34087 RepID=UPI0024688E58|nr:VOC family protein [Sphingobacterium faecium]MDH5826326.1 VOC family protein [Sphingobacterium faecium]
MDPKMIWSNLAVSDLDRTTDFYTALGFRSNGRSNDLTSFLFGQHNFVIHFFLKDILQEAMKGEMTDTSKSNEIIFTIAAESTQQADEWAKEVEAAGGKLISQPEAFGSGYYGFVFADPDGHRFNVFHM